MRNANHAWTTLSEIEKEEYKEKASKVEITKFEDLNQEGQSSMIDGTRKEIQKLVSNFIGYIEENKLRILLLLEFSNMQKLITSHLKKKIKNIVKD